jgi:hypothetical protein
MCNAQYCHTVGGDVQLHTNSALSRFHCNNGYANAPHRTLPTLLEEATTPCRLQLITAPPGHHLNVTPTTDAQFHMLLTSGLHAPADFIPWEMIPDI